MFLKDLLKKVQKTPVPKKNKDGLSSPEVLGVNLVKDEVVVFFDWNKNIFFSIISLLVVGLFVFEIYSGLDYWEEQESIKAKAMEQETTKLKSDIADINNRASAALAYKDKSVAFKEILDNHIYWTNFFEWLEKNTLSTVTYQGYSGGLGGEYEFSASAQNFAEASWQTKVFADNPIVKKVSVDAVQSSGAGDDVNGGVNFGIQLSIDPEVFRSK